MLRENDVGGWTRPAARLYPHQWSWDSAFHAIGLAHVDPSRALAELEHLFDAQWADGRVPHIVFDPAVADYRPGPALWASSATNPAAPRGVATSGLIQPPMHAIAVWRVLQVAKDLQHRVARLYPKLVAWHRYLAVRRDPGGTGLLSVYHPWEGTDNTPRWDAALARLAIGEPPLYARSDMELIDAAERPTKLEYDRYVWLVALLRDAAYDDVAIRKEHPFLIKDIQCSAIFAAASAALERIAAVVGAPARECLEIAGWRRRSCAAVQGQWDPELGLALDLDERTGEHVRVRTSAGLSVLLLPELESTILERTRDVLFGPDFAGATGLAHPVVLSTAANAPEFRPRAYWRGPAWPVVNWLLWRALREHDREADSGRLRAANLALLSAPIGAFAEYYEPYTGEPLGSLHQSWTAAVTLDWIANG
ncbi:MAG: MGH1-like glycoside hydrolase domain-containing protein [Candidatus Limnocylindria bacterium]